MVRRFEATGAGSATGAADTGVSTVMLGAGAMAGGASLGSAATGVSVVGGVYAS
jgi:hypothetical protein